MSLKKNVKLSLELLSMYFVSNYKKGILSIIGYAFILHFFKKEEQRVLPINVVLKALVLAIICYAFIQTHESGTFTYRTKEFFFFFFFV